MYINANESRDRRIERQLVTLLITDIIGSGYGIRVDDGGDELLPLRNTIAESLEDVMNTDEDRLYLYNEVDGKRKRIGWIYLVYGNEPGVVVSDYTTNLDGMLFMEQYNARAEQAQNGELVAWMVD